MVEYIKKFAVVDKPTALENEFQQYKPFSPCEAAMYRRICDIEIEIGKMGAEDVSPVVRGRWILVNTEKGIGVCSNCNRQDRIDHLATHCRFCGARMNNA